MSKVSIVVPAFNVEKYIFRAIDSVLGQDYENIELIIIDDGSTDSTPDAVKQYAKTDPRIVWRTQKNLGVSAARNHGLSIAAGEYVLFLDADDWLEPDAVSYLVGLQKEYPDHLVSADRYFAYLSGSGGISKVRQREEDGIAAVSRSAAINTLSTGEYNLQSACYKLFRREAAQEIGFDESIHHGEDGLFVFEYLLKCSGLVFSNRPLWNILERPGSATQAPYDSRWLSAISAAEIMRSRGYDDLSGTALLLNVIDRIEMVQNAILKSDDFNKDDYRFAKTRLKKYGSEFRKTRPGLKAAVKYLCYSYLPASLLRILVKRKANPKKSF